MTRGSAQFAVGVLLGFVAAFAIVFGLMAAVAAVAVVVVVGLLMPRFAALAGGSLGIGGTWLVLHLNALSRCADARDFCGDAQIFVPWLAVSTSLVLGGVFLAMWTVVVATRRAREP